MKAPIFKNRPIKPGIPKAAILRPFGHLLLKDLQFPLLTESLAYQERSYLPFTCNLITKASLLSSKRLASSEINMKGIVSAHWAMKIMLS